MIGCRRPKWLLEKGPVLTRSTARLPCKCEATFWLLYHLLHRRKQQLARRVVSGGWPVLKAKTACTRHLTECAFTGTRPSLSRNIATNWRLASSCASSAASMTASAKEKLVKTRRHLVSSGGRQPEIQLDVRRRGLRRTSGRSGSVVPTNVAPLKLLHVYYE